MVPLHENHKRSSGGGITTPAKCNFIRISNFKPLVRGFRAFHYPFPHIRAGVEIWIILQLKTAMRKEKNRNPETLAKFRKL